MNNRSRYKLFYIDPINPAQLQVYFLFETVFLIINVFLFSMFIAMVIKVRCHINLKLIGALFFTQYFPSLTGRMFILAHQSGFFHSHPNPYRDIWVILISWWRCYSLSQILTIHFWVAFERQFAMYYSLPCTTSLRYQLQENVWCDKLLKHAALALFFVNMATVSLFLAANLEMVETKFGEETSQWLDCLFNICVAVDGPIMAVGAIYYNDYLVGVIKILLRGPDVKDVKEDKDTGHVYFVQLEQQWGEPQAVEKVDKKRRKGRSRSRQQ